MFVQSQVPRGSLLLPIISFLGKHVGIPCSNHLSIDRYQYISIGLQADQCIIHIRQGQQDTLFISIGGLLGAEPFDFYPPLVLAEFKYGSH